MKLIDKIVGRDRSETGDAGLAQAFRRGDEWAYVELVNRLRAPVHQYAVRIVGNVEVAEEIVQEAFIKVYRFRETYDPSFALTTWVWTIARNSITDWQRGNYSKPLHADSVIEEVASPEPCAETQMIDKSERKKLFRRLRKLPQIQRRVLWLRLIHQLSYQEIARKLGTTLSAVKCAAYRAKSGLGIAARSV